MPCGGRMEDTMVTAIVGANWGDEGKGKITVCQICESDKRYITYGNQGQKCYYMTP